MPDKYEIQKMWRKIMEQDMRIDGSTFLNEYVEYDEIQEPLGDILQASFLTDAELVKVVKNIREDFIERHSARKAFIDSEGE